MKQKPNGVRTSVGRGSKEIACHDLENDSASIYLYRTKDGEYFLRTEKLQIRRDDAWIDHPMDGGLQKTAIRWQETDTPMTEGQAINWCVETLMPECLVPVVKDLIGELVSFDLGDLAEPLARYCKDKGVTESEAIGRALRNYAPGNFRILGKTEEAIAHLQALVGDRFGRDFDTDSGRGTLYISHDSVSLTDPKSSIVAQHMDSIARHLTKAGRARS